MVFTVFGWGSPAPPSPPPSLQTNTPAPHAKKKTPHKNRYTSGTTGKPKGVVHLHKAIVADVCAVRMFFDREGLVLTAADRLVWVVGVWWCCVCWGV